MHGKSDKKHNAHHIHYTDTLHITLHNGVWNPQPLTTPDTPQTSLQTPALSLQQTLKQTCATYTQLLSLSTSLQETITKYCAHTHRKSAARAEENLPRHTRRTLAQLRTNKYPFLLSYLHKIDASLPLCRTHELTTQHLFSCPQIRTTLSALDLWRDPSGVAALLDDRREKLPANPHRTTEADSPR